LANKRLLPANCRAEENGKEKRMSLFVLSADFMRYCTYIAGETCDDYGELPRAFVV
jgi:hypothetical protein